MDYKILFKNLIEKGRFPKSIILESVSRLKRKEFAFFIAKNLLCSDIKCEHKIDENIFPDLKYIFKSGASLTVDKISEGLDFINKTPYESNAVCLIIDDADFMLTEAANSLLKTLEEPPDNSYIILLSTYADSLLPTIRSRSQIYKIPYETKEEFAEKLNILFEKERDDDIKITFTEEDIDFFYNLSDFEVETISFSNYFRVKELFFSFMKKKRDIYEIVHFMESLFLTGKKSDKGLNDETYELFISLLYIFLFDKLLILNNADDSVVFKHFWHENSVDFLCEPSILMEQVVEYYKYRQINFNKKFVGIKLLIKYFKECCE